MEYEPLAPSLVINMHDRSIISNLTCINQQQLVACVILYNPDDRLIENINTYLRYVDKLLVYDNSEESYAHMFHGHEREFDIIYHYLDGNQGIASALNLACREAIQLRYHWILTMDQDSSFKSDDYFRIFNKQDDKDIAAIYAPIHVDEYQTDTQVVDVLFAMTSGNLLNLRIFEELGGFEDKLFIDEVDHDYCLRAKCKGYAIRKICVSINHSVGKHRELHLFGRHEIFFIHSPTRLYYIVRNNLYIFDKYASSFPELIQQRRKMLRKSVLGNLVFDMWRAPQKIWYVLKGMYHYRQKRFGKLAK